MNSMEKNPAKGDRISAYLSAGNREMLFGELSDEFLRSIGALEILKGVPVPLSEGKNGQIAVRDIFLDMGRIIGGDASFVYADRYISYMKAAAGEKAEVILTSEGAAAADAGNYEDACRLLRASLLIEPGSRTALYLYGRACKACYESEDRDEAYVGSFKAEALEVFELLTMIHPDFAMGYYFLGYGYLNLGLYLKTKLTWEDFMKYSSGAGETDSGIDDIQMDDLRHEISGMLLELDEPVRIEEGCNQIMAGNFAGGRAILSEFRDGRYENWWPLWYYLGVAEASLGNAQEAVSDLRRVLTLSPSNTDVMEELAELYEALGDTVNANKYKTKIDVVRKNISEEMQ